MIFCQKKKILVNKTFWSKKLFGKNHFGIRNFWSRKLCDPKDFCLKEKIVQKILYSTEFSLP